MPTDDNGQVRWTVFFSGRVQGVGFRYTTVQIARDFDVAGTVRNLSDGRVEVVAEGSSDELSRFVEKIKQAMEGHIRETQQQESPATGKFSSFEVAY
jgi:acylphosphatase